jgi:hypothetical protein
MKCGGGIDRVWGCMNIQTPEKGAFYVNLRDITFSKRC